MIKNNKDKPNKRVARGWEDEEDNQQQKNTPTNKPQSYFKRDDDQSTKVDNKQGVSTSSIPTTKQTFTVNLEKQLIDSILSSTGITAKPSDSQFKDYLSRIKSLNKDNINNLLHSKLVQFYEENDMKGLQKCLYVIEFSINNKIEEIKLYFQNHSDLLMEMKDNIQGNNKVVEIFNNILILIGKIQKQTVNSFDAKKKFIKQAENKPSNKEPEQSQSNMLDDILCSNNTNVTTESEPVQVQVTSILGDNENEKKKGFGFIKKDKTATNNLNTNEIDFFNNSQTVLVNQTSNINITVVQNHEVKEKKGFGFVKKNNQKENDIISGIDNINLNTESNSNNKKIDLTDILNQVYTEQKPNLEQNISPLNQQYIIPPQNNINNQVPNYVQYQNPNIMNNMYNNGYNPQYQQQMYTPNNLYYQQQIYNPQYTQQNQYPQSQPQPHHIERLKQEDKEEKKQDDKLKFNFLDDLLKPKN